MDPKYELRLTLRINGIIAEPISFTRCTLKDIERIKGDYLNTDDAVLQECYYYLSKEQ